MKTLATIITAAALAVALPACAKEAEKAAQPETKKVCVDVQGKDGKPVIDPKTKKAKQNCTTVKIRKKHEGTAIPDGKK